MGLFSKNNSQSMDKRQVYTQRYNGSRVNLLLVVAFTVINIIMLFAGGESYFLFSAVIPYYLVMNGMFFTGKFEDLPIDDAFRLDDSFFTSMLIIASGITLLYLLCWFFSKNNKVGWLIGALVLIVVDTAGMFYFEIQSVIDIVFHAWVIISLIQGIIAAKKLKELPEDQPLEQVEQPVEQTEQPTDGQNL